MKIKILLLTAFTAAGVLLFSSSLMALGLGVYGTAAKGPISWTYTNEDTDAETDVDSDISKFGLGFTLDTTLAYDRLFNYRLHVGYSKLKIDNEENLENIEGWDFHLYNSFGFGVFRSQPVRIWLGPQIGFGVISAEYDNDNLSKNSFTTLFFSLGAIAGVNFNVSDLVTIAVDGGYRFNWHTGWVSRGNYDYELSGKGKEAFMDVAFMFRVGGDQFQ